MNNLKQEKSVVFEMEICPDYQFEDPHMFIIIKSNGLATKMIVANWDRANELGNSKREWFGKFGTLVCDEGLLCNYLENARSVCWLYGACCSQPVPHRWKTPFLM